MSEAAVSRISKSLYSDYVSSEWEKFLNLLGMNVRYERCTGAELYAADGRRILDFLSGWIEFVNAVEELVALVHSSGTFWSEALGLARRALTS
jgi:hypothetical protein